MIGRIRAAVRAFLEGDGKPTGQALPAEPGHGFRTRGEVTVVTKNGGTVEVHPTALLNSLPTGYHVGMPFKTALLVDRPGAFIRIGAECRIHGSYIHAWKGITIGRGVLIAAGTNIVDAHGHSTDVRYARFRRYFHDRPEEIRIDDYAWIGMNCTILKGVHVGECAIVASGSVVREDVPAFAVVEGVPARVVRRLNPGDALPESYPLEELSREDGYYEY